MNWIFSKSDQRSATVTLAAFLFALAPVWTKSVATAQDLPEYESHVVVVQFGPEISIQNKSDRTGLQSFDRSAEAYDVHTIERVYPFLDQVQPTPRIRHNLMALRRTYFVRYSVNAAPTDVAEVLAMSPGVVYAEPLLINRTLVSGEPRLVDPNDPKFNEQAYLRNLRLPEAWDLVKSESGSPRVVIAIVDGGGAWRHEDLNANVWTNANEVADNGVDDDGNGFIDDVHGVNFANNNQTNNDPSGLPWTPANANHGTYGAGAASAVSDNGTGIAGTAWNADLMHINAGCENIDGAICYGYQGILYAAANGADIINASWGGPHRDDASVNLVTQTLNLATDMGALVVAAAGNTHLSNDLVRFFPARHPRVLSVGATETNSRSITRFSHYGQLVNVFAPGVSITTTAVGDQYASVSGTSLASPLVAGIAALVKTRFPEMSPDSVREQVRVTSENMDSENPDFSGRLGNGYVNALSAVQRPSLPGVRLRRWSWTDRDGDRQIASGDVVTIKAMVVNHLADASQLKVGLVAAETYSFIDITTPEVTVGNLAGGDSVEVSFELTVAADAPKNTQLRFFTRISEGTFEDSPDMIAFLINRSLKVVHQSLSALYTETNGDAWIENTNWDISSVPTETELTTWFGLFLTEGRLFVIYMPGNNLNGTLPDELGNLSNLQQLLLPGNFLSGQIPAELGNLTQLQGLRLAGNTLSGEIPASLGRLSRLEGLWLHINSLSGAIPAELGNLSNLKSLDLEENSLSESIPPELGNLRQLEELYLGSNKLSGPIPAQLGNLELLRELSLYFNSLTGPIPPELGRLLQLQMLRLELNQLTGAIPAEIGKLSQLRWLSLSENSLTGSIPSSIGNLTQLQQLNLDYNSLSGSIPSSIGNLRELRQMFIEGNSLTGAIPPEMGNLSQLTQLVMVGNSLTGTMPGQIGRLTQLEGLHLGGNMLSGSIPVELGNLTKLHELNLEANSLTGTVPPELGNLEQLHSLAINDNALTGMLPRRLMQLSNLQEFHFGGQALCAPKDADFQAWLSSLPYSNGPTCGALQIAESVASQAYTQGQVIATLILPEASGGTVPYAYTLEPALPAGLTFDIGARSVSGVPSSAAQATPYTYSATDADGNSASLTFSIEVAEAVAIEWVILDFNFARGERINPIELPPAEGGVPPLTYTLEPALPVGMMFDDSLRTISGTPTVVNAGMVPYVYRATDVNGSNDSLNFNITVYSPVASEQDAMPEIFAVHGNYPNPFEYSTRLVVDLPWPARVTVEVLDVTGRRVLFVPPVGMFAGRNQAIELSGASMPSGMYMYRMLADSREGRAMHVGRLVRVR